MARAGCDVRRAAPEGVLVRRLREYAGDGVRGLKREDWATAQDARGSRPAVVDLASGLEGVHGTRDGFTDRMRELSCELAPEWSFPT